MPHPATPLLQALTTTEGAAFKAALAQLMALDLGQLTHAEAAQVLGVLADVQAKLQAQQQQAASALAALRQKANALAAYGGKS